MARDKLWQLSDVVSDARKRLNAPFIAISGRVIHV